MIHYGSPYCTKKDLGGAYNRFLALIPEGDYACLVDGDTLFTTNDYGRLIAACVAQNPACRLFYATTNRVGCPWQVLPDAPVGDNITQHRNFGLWRSQRFGTEVVERRHEEVPGSGFLILLRKDLWDQVKFESGFAGVDWTFFRQVARQESVLQMLGVYLYHWYRPVLSTWSSDVCQDLRAAGRPDPSHDPAQPG